MLTFWEGHRIISVKIGRKVDRDGRNDQSVAYGDIVDLELPRPVSVVNGHVFGASRAELRYIRGGVTRML